MPSAYIPLLLFSMLVPHEEVAMRKQFRHAPLDPLSPAA